MDQDCVHECLENADLVLDCVFLDHEQTTSRLRQEIHNVFDKDKPVIISVSGKKFDNPGAYDLIWTKPFPTLDQMRQDLGRVLKTRTCRSPVSSDGSEGHVIQPEH